MCVCCVCALCVWRSLAALLCVANARETGPAVCVFNRLPVRESGSSRSKISRKEYYRKEHYPAGSKHLFILPLALLGVWCSYDVPIAAPASARENWSRSFPLSTSCCNSLNSEYSCDTCARKGDPDGSEQGQRAGSQWAGCVGKVIARTALPRSSSSRSLIRDMVLNSSISSRAWTGTRCHVARPQGLLSCWGLWQIER